MVVNSCNAFPDIYLVAENRVVKITFLKIGTSEPTAEVFFSQVPGVCWALSKHTELICIYQYEESRTLCIHDAWATAREC
jgi:hypothetical protein